MNHRFFIKTITNYFLECVLSIIPVQNPVLFKQSLVTKCTSKKMKVFEPLTESASEFEMQANHKRALF